MNSIPNSLAWGLRCRCLLILRCLLIVKVWDDSVVENATHSADPDRRWSALAAAANLWIPISATVLAFLGMLLVAFHTNVAILAPIVTPRVHQKPVRNMFSSILFGLPIADQDNGMINYCILWTSRSSQV